MPLRRSNASRQLPVATITPSTAASARWLAGINLAAEFLYFAAKAFTSYESCFGSPRAAGTLATDFRGGGEARLKPLLFLRFEEIEQPA